MMIRRERHPMTWINPARDLLSLEPEGRSLFKGWP